MLTFVVYGDNLEKITLKATTLKGACQSAARRGFAELFVENQGIEIAQYAEVCGHWVKV